MPMHIDEKKIAVDELNKIAKKATSAIAADYHGTSVSELTTLRKKARNSSVYLKVIRNTLARKALIDTKFSCLDKLLVGPTILAFSLDDPASAAKLANDFYKVNSKFTVKGLTMGETLLELSKLKILANLPSKDEAISQLAALLSAPLVKLALTANEIPTKLTRTFEAVKHLKQQAES